MYQQRRKRLKATVEGDEGKRYQYNLTSSQWTILPFSKGSGNYKITIYQNVSGNKYRPLLDEVINVDLSNELNPFLAANQYVNFTSDSKVVQKASELVQNAQNDAEKVSAIYNYIVSNMTYDYDKAENISSPYLPDLEEILESKKGICLDYSALIVGMLRSQNIPAKIVIGYSGEVYHAWISVYLEEEVTSLCGMTYYDEAHWLHMDPTFDSGNNSSRAVLRYINNSNNYAGEYYY